MYIPPSVNEIPPFPTGNQNKHIQLPPLGEIEIGDMLVSRYDKSAWAGYFPWEDWHHAALINKTYPLTIIEAAGPNSENQWPGPAEVLFESSVGFGKAKEIQEIVWLKPVFPNPIREITSKQIQRSKRKIITLNEARRRIIAYAQQQLDELYTLASSKWNENSWYCSSLIYKSYSRTITDMHLETHDDIRAGFFVTPEDLLNSKKTKQYFSWQYKNNLLEV